MRWDWKNRRKGPFSPPRELNNDTDRSGRLVMDPVSPLFDLEKVNEQHVPCMQIHTDIRSRAMLGAGAPAESFGRSSPSPWMRARVATGCSKKKRFVLGFFYLGLDL